MKKRIAVLTVLLMTGLTVGCGSKKKETTQIVQTETYTDENTISVVSHDTEDVDFNVAVVDGPMMEGFEGLMKDSANEEAANVYRFTTYETVEDYETLFRWGTVDIATMPLEEAAALYEEKQGFLCVLSINYAGGEEMQTGENQTPETSDESETEPEKEEQTALPEYGVTVATIDFARTYPAAIQLFMEEMEFSAGDTTCITGDEMKTMLQDYFTKAEIEQPGDNFYYPLPKLTPKEEQFYLDEAKETENEE